MTMKPWFWRCPLCGARRNERCKSPCGWYYGWYHKARWNANLYWNSPAQIDRQQWNRIA